jgi:hypothetical protein
MPKIIDSLSQTNFLDKNFIGTVTFKSEDISLPDGSKMALGIDDGHWILIYQKPKDKHFEVLKYSHHDKKIYVGQKLGGKEDFVLFKKHVKYFFSHASVQDLVTLLPEGRND